MGQETFINTEFVNNTCALLCAFTQVAFSLRGFYMYSSIFPLVILGYTVIVN